MNQTPLILEPRPAVETALGIGRSAVYAAMEAGLLPRPVRRGVRAVAWPRHEIQAIVAARLAGKSDDEIRALVRGLIASRQQTASAV